MKMNYRKVPRHWKYITTNFYRVKIPLLRVFHDGDFIGIDTDGTLLIRVRYKWDGASGIAIDTKNFMRGSLVHDALYQLLREGVLAQGDRIIADRILRDICIEDGMSRLRAWWVYNAVRMFGASSAKPR